MAEPSAESLQRARDKSNPQTGLIRDPQLAMDFTIDEYAQMLDAQRVGTIELKIKDLEKEIAMHERAEENKAADEMLKDPRIRKMFKLDGD